MPKIGVSNVQLCYTHRLTRAYLKQTLNIYEGWISLELITMYVYARMIVCNSCESTIIKPRTGHIDLKGT